MQDKTALEDCIKKTVMFKMPQIIIGKVSYKNYYVGNFFYCFKTALIVWLKKKNLLNL